MCQAIAVESLATSRVGGATLAMHRGMTQSPRRVLIVEDEQCIRDVLVELFETEGVEVSAAASLDYAKWVLGRRTFDLVVTDIRLGGRRDGGLQVMAAAGMLSPEATVIALTAFPDDSARRTSSRSRSRSSGSPSWPRRRGCRRRSSRSRRATRHDARLSRHAPSDGPAGAEHHTGG